MSLRIGFAALAFFGCADADVGREDRDLGGPSFPAPEPRALPHGPHLLVSNSGGDSVSVVDAQSKRVVFQLRVGVDPVDIDGPHHIGFDAASNEIVTVFSYPPPQVIPGPHAAHGLSARPGRLARIDIRTGAVVATAGVDQSPGDVALSEDGRRVVVSHFDLKRAMPDPATSLDDKRARVMAFDRATLGDPSASPFRNRVCVAPHALALSPSDGRYVHVACYGEDSVALIDLDARTILARVPVGPAPGAPGAPNYGPYALAIERTSGRVFVSNAVSRSVSILDGAPPGAPSSVAEVPVGGAPYFGHASGGVFTFATQGPDRVARIDVQGQILADTVASGCIAPHEVGPGAPGELVVVCEGDHVGAGELVFLRESDLSVVGRTEVGVFPDRALLVDLP